MPVVPISAPRAASEARTSQAQTLLPDPTFALMAAAQMHSEGRLLAKDQTQAQPLANQPARR